ncbi:MAG: cytochrome c3 family protein [Bacteroidetes bacterium]|nr:cytochrome c3 family protein [Bacteroidota bacterium]
MNKIFPFPRWVKETGVLKSNVLIIIPGLLLLPVLFGNRNIEGLNYTTVEKINPDKRYSSDDKKCLDCHAALFEKTIKHTTSTGKECEDCHKSNGSEHPKTGITSFLLAEKLPDLCLSCHDKIKNAISKSHFIHGSLTDNKSCLNCHSPHSSSEKGLLTAIKREVCFSCHNKTITGKSGTILNIEQLYTNSEVKHPPVKKCSSTCHNPHASDFKHLLSNAYPEDEYAPANADSFALCFICHEDMDLIEAPKTNAATAFRNGEGNLHYVHVHGEKGRKCTLCHSPHATKNEHLIRDAVKFGNFEFKLNYKSDSTGGSCFPGCHVEKKYNRLMIKSDSLLNK